MLTPIHTHLPIQRSATKLTLALFMMMAATSCRGQSADRDPARADSMATGITMAFDYAGAEAILGALERDSLATADVDSLLRIHGVRATVDNVTRYFPKIGEPEFRQAIQSFVGTQRPPEGGEPYFQFDDVWRSRRQTRSLIRKLRENEAGFVSRILVDLAPSQPRTAPLAMKVFFVAGGVSDGFVPDSPGIASFYANLSRARGDYESVLSNAAHEAYHVMQKAAQRQVPGLRAVADSVERLPGAQRLLATVLAEGVAKYVVDPRAGYGRRTSSRRVREDFAVFDTVLAGLRNGTISWDSASARGFTGAEDQRFYFVGYEMANAIERYCGRPCIARLFEEQPVEFFRQYFRLYREHPEIVGRFVTATEAFLGSTGRTGG
jgi:hypothetical protein